MQILLLYKSAPSIPSRNLERDFSVYRPLSPGRVVSDRDVWVRSHRFTCPSYA
jgi:hypothetical protein